MHGSFAFGVREADTDDRVVLEERHRRGSLLDEGALTFCECRNGSVEIGSPHRRTPVGIDRVLWPLHLNHQIARVGSQAIDPVEVETALSEEMEEELRALVLPAAEIDPRQKA